MQSKRIRKKSLNIIKRGRPTLVDRTILKDKTMTICLTPELYSQLKSTAIQQNQKPAAMARILIETGIEYETVDFVGDEVTDKDVSVSGGEPPGHPQMEVTFQEDHAMDWLKKIVDDHDEKEKEENRQRLQKIENEKKMEADLQAQWETCINDILRPILSEYETLLESKGYTAQSKSPIATDGQTGKQGMKLYSFGISNLKGRTGNSNPLPTHTINFSRNNLSDLISVNATPPGLMDDHEVAIGSINREKIEDLMKQFFKKVFS